MLVNVFTILAWGTIACGIALKAMVCIPIATIFAGLAVCALIGRWMKRLEPGTKRPSVVLAIIGLALFGLFVLPAFFMPYGGGSWKYDLDAQQLSKFTQKVQQAVSKHKDEIAKIPEQGTSAQLFLELWKHQYLTIDDIGLLAGASGDKAPEGSLANTAFSSEENCLFSGPRDGATLVKLINGQPKDGILFSYNRHWIVKYERIAVIFAGEKNAHAWSLEEIIDHYNQQTSTNIECPDDGSPDPDKIFALTPFRNVAQE